MSRLEKAEKIVLVCLATALLIGLWHGYPLPNVVGDEMYFVGGPLRAIANHTLVPLLGDVPYGTLTYLLNYVAWLPVLAILFVLKGFSVVAVQTSLLTHPFAGYILTRLLSVGIVLALFLLMRDQLRKWYALSVRGTLVLLGITFGNILVFSIAHSGKVWILSIFLYVISLTFAERARVSVPISIANKYAFVSIVAAWAAFANFPIMGIALLTLPWLLYLVYKRKVTWRWFLGGNLVGVGILAFVLFLNLSSIQGQVFSIFHDYSRLTSAHKYGLSFTQALPLNALKVMLLFPLHVLILIFVAYKGKRAGTSQSLLYAHLGAYLVILSTVASWSLGPDTFLRYLLPVPFLLCLLLATYQSIGRKLSLVAVSITLVFALRALWLIALPTTYTQALTWTQANLSEESVVLLDKVAYDFELPHNKYSAALVRDEMCATRCQWQRSHEDETFKPVVIDEHSDPIRAATVSLVAGYVYTAERSQDGHEGKLVAEFQSGAPDAAFYSLNSLGSYFDPLFFRLNRLGRNIYIYKVEK